MPGPGPVTQLGTSDAGSEAMYELRMCCAKAVIVVMVLIYGGASGEGKKEK